MVPPDRGRRRRAVRTQDSAARRRPGRIAAPELRRFRCGASALREYDYTGAASFAKNRRDLLSMFCSRVFVNSTILLDLVGALIEQQKVLNVLKQHRGDLAMLG